MDFALPLEDDDDSNQGAIMASLDPKLNEAANKVDKRSPTPGNDSKRSWPDVLSCNEMQSLNLHADHDNNGLSFLLLDGQDHLLIDSAEHFALKLGCDLSVNAKVSCHSTALKRMVNQ